MTDQPPTEILPICPYCADRRVIPWRGGRIRALDVFSCSELNWGVILLLRTGPVVGAACGRFVR